MKKDLSGSVSASVRIGDQVTALVKRGEKSWGYIYIALGFALSIEGTIVQMITPLCWPWNLLVYLFLMVGTTYLFLLNGGFQNWLIGLRNRYEDKAR